MTISFLENFKKIIASENQIYPLSTLESAELRRSFKSKRYFRFLNIYSGLLYRNFILSSFVLPKITKNSLKSNKEKKISVMMRVKNEEEFIEKSILSILQHVDEVVVIDNNSTDATPNIIAGLQKRYPEKVKIFNYKHRVAGCGKENENEYLRSVHSPKLLASYYNWCLKKCMYNFILKWDGDMIATPLLCKHLDEFKNNPSLSLIFGGLNIAPDRVHSVLPGLDREPRLFKKRFSYYISDKNFEVLFNPYFSQSAVLEHAGCLHLKFCKKNPFENQSPNFKQNYSNHHTLGPMLQIETISLLRTWNIV